MYKITRILLAACAWGALAVPSASAADMPPAYTPPPPPAAVLGGWYLRGDIGYSNQRVDELDNVLYDDFDTLDEGDRDFDGGPIFGVGVGYRFNKWFRVDVTGEHRAAVDFTGNDIGVIGADTFSNNYDAKKSEWLAMINAYADLGTYRGITPFVGAGVGMIRTEIAGFTDIGTNSADNLVAIAYGADNSEWSFAWALYAGLGFEITPNLTLELAYRYLDIGDAESGDLVAFDGTNDVDNPMEFNDLTSHDVRLGMRYMFN